MAQDLDVFFGGGFLGALVLALMLFSAAVKASSAAALLPSWHSALGALGALLAGEEGLAFFFLGSLVDCSNLLCHSFRMVLVLSSMPTENLSAKLPVIK